ncbi:peptidoglycan DD-metalloendopeptidase family protein [Staphylococcus haemolyticus]|uniref:peptidoglycan DD-metalloendopeptidase family protein n=1 Tax=Staphylococcus haemolyticus TaxID=1283 RepID=UPI000E6A39AC|nr:peptidoglycan DD-metalloendopeptidase family protein [Staphylococcus haemolyticus]RIO67119.1 peptidase M23 [Staphylococcus haemolyticus]
MADFNLGAEVSMDVDPLKAEAGTLERELKNINKSLRSQRSEFKKNELSAEQLADREKQLGRAIKAQEGLLRKRKNKLSEVRAEISNSNKVTETQKVKLNSASRAVQQAENQLSTYNRELKETELAYKQFNRSSDQVKNSLGELKNRAKLSEIAFKQGTRSVDNYKDRLTEMNYTITKSKANINLLKQNLKEVSLAHGSTSRQADKLRNDILKESIAMQIAQGRADELSDELDKVARSQRKVRLATTLIGAGFAGARDSADRIATTLRSVGEVTQGVVGEVMATQFANLVPIMGSVVSAGAGLGGMVTALGGAAIGLGGSYAIALGAVKAFTGQATYALKMLEDGTLSITSETAKYQQSLASLKTQWEGLIAQNQAKLFNTMTNGINMAKTALSQLNPFLTTTAGQIERFSSRLLNWVNTSNNVKNAFNILNTQGTQAFSHLLNGAFHFVDGTVAVFNKLSPLFVWASKGFENMTLSFRRWANSVEGSRAINNFIEYTKTNLPIVGRIFGNIFGGIFNLFSAFSGHSHNVLLGIESVTEGFKNWSAELKRSDGFQQFVQYLETNGPKVWTLIKNITGILWGLIKGMAPVGAVTLSVTNAITGWMSSMMNTHPVIGQLIGRIVAGGGALLLFLKPLFLIKGALGGMRGALLAVTGAQKVFGATGAIATLKLNIFKNSIMATRVAMRVMKGEMALSTVMTRKYGLATKVAAVGAKGLQLAIKGVGLALRFMTGPVGIVITVIAALTAGIIYLWKNNETFRNFVIKAWTGIKNTAIAVFGFLKPYIINIWNAIKNASIAVWNGLKTAASATWNGIKFAVQHPIQALKNIITAVWVGIKTASITIWNAIKNGVMAILRGWITLMRASFTALKSFFSGIWNFIKNISVKTWNAIKNGVLSAVKALNTGVRKIISTLKSWMVNAWNFIKNKVVTLAKGLYTSVKNAFNSLWNATKKIFTTLKNWAIKIWTTLKNKVVALAKSLYTNVKKAFTNLWNSTKSIFNKLKNWVIKLWTSLKNKIISVAKSLYNSVKSRWNALWNTTKSIFSKLKNWAIKTWNTLKNKIISIVKSLWNGVKNRWNALWNGTRSIFNKVKNFMTNTWTKIKSSVVNIVKSLWSKVKGTFNNMKNGLKNIIDKIKGHISGMVNKVKDGLNKLIKGVNWVADKIGMPKIDPIKLSTGTETTHTQNYVTNGKLNRDTFATVGDKGKGNGPGGFRHEMIRYPNGKTAITPNRDTTAFLPKGSTVYNGAQTHAMLSSQPRFNLGTLPKFSIGSMWKNTKKKAGQIINGVGDKANGVKHKAMAMGDKALDTAKGIAKGTFKAIGDVFDYVSNPGKLVDKVLSAAGVDFSFVKGDILGGLMKAMYKKLKNGIKNLFDGWLEEGGGADLSSFDKYPITTPYSPNARVPGYPFGNGRHYGIDYGTPSGTTIKAPTSGTVSRKHDYGGGLVARLVNGKFTQWFLHLSDILKTGKVKQGEPFAKTGNSGHWTTGAHLHYQVEKGINDYITNRNTIDPKKFASMGGGGGINKSAAAWKPDIRRAAKAIGVRVSNVDVNDVARLIQTESSGNAGVTQQIQDVNSGGNEAQGLLQYTPGSFNSYAIRGHKNIKNGYDQLLAFFNNTDWRANLSYWKRRIASGLTGWGPTGRRKKYATGTNNARKGYATVFEKGGEIMNLRGGEQIIPNDVSIAAIERVINSDIFNRTQSAVYEAISRFADGIREKQQQESIEKAELRRLQTENTDIKEQNALLKAILGKMDALLNINNDINQSNQEIRDKNYFPSSKEMTRMNNENNALNAKTRLMARR